MKNNKYKWFKIFFVVIAVIIALNVSLVYAILPKSIAEQKENNVENQQEETNNENLFEGEEVITLKDPVEIVEYAQQKINKKVNFETTLEAKINVNMSMLNFPIQIKTKTSVNSDGIYYTTDACNMYQKWLQGQKGYCFYGKYESDIIYTRNTYDVTFDTCVPVFKGDFYKVNANDCKSEHGIMNYSNVVIVNKDSVARVENFKNENEIYTIELRIKKDKLTELQQKTYKWAYLVRRPNITSFTVTYQIDKYGNFINAEYNFSCYGTRNTQLGQISGTISGTFYQNFNYYNDVHFMIPTAIQF